MTPAATLTRVPVVVDHTMRSDILW